MKYELHHGDCLDVLKTLADCSVDAIVTDPPYGLGKEPDPVKVMAAWISQGYFEVEGGGFMGKKWDAFVPQPIIWKEAFRVLKPGGHLLAFAGTRTQDWMAMSLRFAGFEIRDMIAWVYGQGFPKSYNLDNNQGLLTCNCEGDTVPYTHEKELSRKPQAERQLSNMSSSDVSQAEHPGERGGEILQQGLQEQGSPIAGRQELWSSKDGFEQPGMERRGHAEKTTRQLQGRSVRSSSTGGTGDGEEGRLHNGASPSDGLYVRIPDDEAGSRQSYRPQPIEQRPEQSGALADERRPQARRVWPMCDRCSKPIIPKGLGTALKPALEPITLARKPPIGTIAANVLEHGTGGLNIDGCRVEANGDKLGGGRISTTTDGWDRPWKHDSEAIEACKARGDEAVAKAEQLGRFPANFIHDGSEEVLALFPSEAGGGYGKRGGRDGATVGDYGMGATMETVGYDNTGSAARFFYCAKASRDDRDEGCGALELKRTAKLGGSDNDRDDLDPVSERFRTQPSRNPHPTVKPTDLMRYLCRLITPPGGIVLDPFTGSGSTGKAAMAEGFRFIGIEREAEYIEIARARISAEAEKPRQLSLF